MSAIADALVLIGYGIFIAIILCGAGYHAVRAVRQRDGADAVLAGFMAAAAFMAAGFVLTIFA